MVGELIQQLALLVAVVLVLAVLPKLLWRDWTRNSVILKGGGGRSGGGLFGLAVAGLIVKGLTRLAVAVAQAVGSAVVALVNLAARGTGSAWRWGLHETARRSEQRGRDSDGLEELWRRS